MNALPLKPQLSLPDRLDDLIADHGLRQVLLTLLARIAKRTRPPDRVPRKLDMLSDHMRADLGLPPAAPHRAKVDQYALWYRSY